MPHYTLTSGDESPTPGGFATDPALTGRALETLIERGWVRRERSEEDRRRLELAERVVAVLDERDLEDFARAAHKMIAAFGLATE